MRINFYIGTKVESPPSPEPSPAPSGELSRKGYYAIVKIFSPSGRLRGRRLIVVRENAAANGAPSFAPEYQVAVLGDLGAFSEGTIDRFLRKVRRQTGLTEIEEFRGETSSFDPEQGALTDAQVSDFLATLAGTKS